MPVFRFFAALVLVGLIAIAGVSLYNAGVSAGIAQDVGHAIASGAPVPAGYYYGPYIGHPWGFGFGFGFGGLFFGILFFFLIFGLIRAVFGFGRWGGHHGGGYMKGRYGGWRDSMSEWHDEQHGKAADAPAPDKT
jgi:hypothetical protein